VESGKGFPGLQADRMNTAMSKPVKGDKPTFFIIASFFPLPDNCYNII
jgi:hypothetical protein